MNAPSAPHRMFDCMLDLETMGNGPNAAIVAIGAVLFDDVYGRTGEDFYSVVDLESSVNMGGIIDASTVQWWLRQAPDARLEINGDTPGRHLAAVLADFAEFIQTHSNPGHVRMWGNGAAFDNVILASAYRRSGIIQPWKHCNDRCYRTIKAEHPGIVMDRRGIHHHARDDALSQAHHLIQIRAHQIQAQNRAGGAS